MCLARLTQYKRHWDEVGVSELITVKGNTLKQILLLWCKKEPVKQKMFPFKKDTRIMVQKA